MKSESMSSGTILLSIIGLLLILVPVKLLLRFDRKLGNAIYRFSENEAIGLRRATWFYRILGLGVFAYSLWLSQYV